MDEPFITVDLHGMRCDEAEKKIETHAEEVAREIKDNGDKIKDMTREKIREEELKREEAEKEEEGNK